MNRLPEINKTDLQEIIESAHEKIRQFERKIKNAESRIEGLTREYDEVSAVLEYQQRNEDRRNLLSQFRKDGEYGTAPPVVAQEQLADFQAMANWLKPEIERLEKAKAERQEQIKFIEDDLALLERILRFWSRAPYHEAAVVDC